VLPDVALDFPLESLEVRGVGAAHTAPWMCEITACPDLPA